jgi:hypothetical protein
VDREPQKCRVLRWRGTLLFLFQDDVNRQKLDRGGAVAADGVDVLGAQRVRPDDGVGDDVAADAQDDVDLGVVQGDFVASVDQEVLGGHTEPDPLASSAEGPHMSLDERVDTAHLPREHVGVDEFEENDTTHGALDRPEGKSAVAESPFCAEQT